MSQTLQRFVVRMLYDSRLVDQIYTGQVPDALRPEEAAMLRAAPRGAWATDPYRQSRTLHALLEEYPVSAALCGVRGLHAFFQDAMFHRAIMAREHLALAFGQWLRPRAEPIAVLELAIARLRRRTDAPPTAGWLVTAPHLLPVGLVEGTLVAYQQLRSTLGPRPLERLSEPDFRPLPRPRLGQGSEHWLLERGADGNVSLGGGSAGLCGLLEAALSPVSEAHLIRAACRLGAEDEEEARGILAGLLEDGLLLRGSGTGATAEDREREQEAEHE